MTLQCLKQLAIVTGLTILSGWSETDCLQDVQFVRIGHLVLHTLPERDDEGAPIVGLEVPDDICIARLQRRCGVRQKVENRWRGTTSPKPPPSQDT
jgi:hypothetical protein